MAYISTTRAITLFIVIKGVNFVCLRADFLEYFKISLAHSKLSVLADTYGPYPVLVLLLLLFIAIIDRVFLLYDPAYHACLTRHLSYWVCQTCCRFLLCFPDTFIFMPSQ